MRGRARGTQKAWTGQARIKPYARGPIRWTRVLVGVTGSPWTLSVMLRAKPIPTYDGRRLGRRASSAQPVRAAVRPRRTCSGPAIRSRSNAGGLRATCERTAKHGGFYMIPLLESPADEAQRLRGRLSQLVANTALPALLTRCGLGVVVAGCKEAASQIGTAWGSSCQSPIERRKTPWPDWCRAERPVRRHLPVSGTPFAVFRKAG